MPSENHLHHHHLGHSGGLSPHHHHLVGIGNGLTTLKVKSKIFLTVKERNATIYWFTQRSEKFI